ncbi:MAG: molybdopterin molybdotransferase MoeA [Anaerolineaceae bacterium]|nr:molybdopterin molybdotransferase MoeA [Anaerolineaceae bacterium]
METLLSVESARNIILEKFQIKNSVLLSLTASLARVLSTDIFAILNLPPFNNSSMDGFAVISENIQDASNQNPVKLDVVEDIAAGMAPRHTINSGQASRIMTGAPLPPGADAVVPVEDTNFSDRYYQRELPSCIQVFRSVSPGDYVRPQGQDIRKGEKIFSKGHLLRPQDLGFLAAQGFEKIETVAQPVIALLSSGDELAKPGETLQPGKIYDSNTITIKSLIESFGAKVIDLGIARDDLADIHNKLQSVQSLQIDLLVSTAGVSVGVYDFIREVILKDGILNFWKVNMRPGKPLTFGEYMQIPFIGLPGNPVSAFVSTLIFIKPIIHQLLGIQKNIDLHTAILNEEINSDGRESYLRAEVLFDQGNYLAKLTGHQGSGNIYSLVCANALLIIPAGVKSLPKGNKVNFFWI